MTHLVNYKELYVAEDLIQLWIPPTGYLIGIVISYVEYPMDYKWELTEPNGVPLYAEQNVFYEGFWDTGYYFPEPLPNMNTATPYILNFIGSHPTLTVRLFSHWPK